MFRSSKVSEEGFARFMQDLTDPSIALNRVSSPYSLAKTDAPIIASYCIYRDAEFLRSSLDSVCMYVDTVLVLEGKFLDFSPLPDDGTFRIISETASRFDPQFFSGEQNFQKIVYLDSEFSFGPMLETEKRDLILQYIRPGGFSFIIDGDEIAIGDVKAGLDFVRSHPEKRIFWVWVEEEGNPGWKPRIIKVEPGLHYGVNHWTILDKQKEILTDSVFKPSPDFEKIQSFRIYNFGSKRSGPRGEARIAYRESMRKKEWKEIKAEVRAES